MALKLRSVNITSRDWCKVLKSFIVIPPLMDETKDTIVVDEHEKTNVLNSYFTKQSTTDDSANSLPDDKNEINDNSLDSITITPAEVLDVLRTLRLGKPSGPDGINNHILRKVALQISNPLSLIYNQSLNTSIFPSSWKISNVFPIFKSGDSAITSNYRPVSLLNTMEKVFESIIFKHVFNHLNDTNFFTPSQSGFLPGDSTVNQVVFLYDKICKALDEGLEIRVIFFDISKAFDKVWHKGLLYKLHKAGIGSKLLSWFSDYLLNRYQRVVQPGAVSDLSSINAGVPQGSIVGLLLFLVYINDIVNDIESNINLLADETSLSMVVGDPDTTGAILQTDINRITDWVKFNPSKSESLIISRKRNKPVHPELFMSGVGIPSVQVHKHLGIFISNDGSWDYHVNQSLTKAWKRIGIMRRLKLRLDRTSLQTIYFSFIGPILEYADVIWMNLSQYQKDQIEKVQNEAARIVTGCSKLLSLTDLNKESGWETLSQRRYKHKLILFFKMVNGLSLLI